MTFTDGKTVTIKYSAPSMRGRKIFGGLVPYDEVWRTGANAATSLKTDVDLIIGGAGRSRRRIYVVHAACMSGWKLIINKQTGQWGTEYSQGQDLARVNMKLDQRSSGRWRCSPSPSTRRAAISAMLKLEWANTIASVNVKEKK